MAFPDVSVIKSTGGLGRQKPQDDGIAALITQGVAIAGKLNLNEVYELRSLQAAEAIGITVAAMPLVRHQLSEFFRLAPGQILNLMVVSQATTMAQMADRTLTHAKRLLSGLNGKVKHFGLCLNPAAGYIPVIAGGLDADVMAAVAKAQALTAEEFAQHRPTLAIIAGHGLQLNTAAVTDLRTQLAENVAVVIGSDGLKYDTEPAIGAVLGMLSATQVHLNIGYVGACQLAGDGSFLSAGLSNGKTLQELLPGEAAALHDKGYILAIQHPGIDGFFFSDSPTATAAAGDYSQLENVRTINKAARVVRAALLPALKGPLPLTREGKLQPQVVGELESKGRSALEALMLRTGEISQLDVFIDPDQLVVSSSELQVKFSIVPVGVARNIIATIGLTKAL